MAGVLRYTLVVRHPETLAATALLSGQPVPDWASDLVDADNLEPAGKSPDTGEVAAGYGDLKVAELKAEIDKRNADRDPAGETYLSGEGKKADLVAVLEADDAAQQ